MNLSKPIISVIVPVYNCELTVRPFLKCLLNQKNIEPEEVEIVIVDNGSNDKTPDLVREFPVKLYFETSVRSPYAARNRGIVESSGDILAFTDANKFPGEKWIAAGLEALRETGAEIAGGEIRFEIGKEPSAAELYDSITFNNNRKLVHKERASVTGNFFVRRSQFEEVGLFPEGFRSGMDVWWSQRAVKNGAVLAFAENAVVTCQPRNFQEVMRKSYRVGVTHPFIMSERGIPISRILIETLKTFAPPAFSPLKECVEVQESGVSIFALWGTAWCSKIMMGFGRTSGIFRLPRFLKQTP